MGCFVLFVGTGLPDGPKLLCATFAKRTVEDAGRYNIIESAYREIATGINALAMTNKIVRVVMGEVG